MLNAEELVRQNLSLQKSGGPGHRRGLKNVVAVGDQNELGSIQKLKDSLYEILNRERIERVSVRSQADYVRNDDGAPFIRVTRKMGKWNLFGYFRNTELCLHPHEALFLVEMNKLELYIHSVIVSLEQAYSLLLGEGGLPAEAYFVYSTLMRASHVVQLHTKPSTEKLVNASTGSLAWICLIQLLSGNVDPTKSENIQLRETALSMRSISNEIRNSQAQVPLPINAPPKDMGQWDPSATSNSKRSHSVASPSHQHRLEPLFDILDDPSETVRAFQHIFRTLQIIHLTVYDDDEHDSDDDQNMCPIVFDLFVANAEHRKSDPGTPTYRIVVLRDGQGVPSRRAIYRRYVEQSIRTPILVVFVNDAMNMQAYCYVLSR